MIDGSWLMVLDWWFLIDGSWLIWFIHPRKLKGSDFKSVEGESVASSKVVGKVGDNIRVAVREEILQLAREGTFSPILQSPASTMSGNSDGKITC